MLKELNCCGLPCPEPVLRTRVALADADLSAIEVLVDNAAASENVRRFLENNGCSATVVQKNATLWAVTASRGCAIAEAAPAEAPVLGNTASPAPQAARKTLVFISTPVLGRGDDQLGAKLMENFIATLPELGDKLWRIVLVNGGVTLAATEGKALDGLKALAAAGVSILVCGACLNFYQLMEKKQVGDVTNMLDIVTSLDLADKIIRP